MTDKLGFTAKLTTMVANGTLPGRIADKLPDLVGAVLDADDVLQIARILEQCVMADEAADKWRKAYEREHEAKEDWIESYKAVARKAYSAKLPDDIDLGAQRGPAC